MPTHHPQAGRLACETAAQCERVAAGMETLVLQSITVTVVVVVGALALWHAFRLQRAIRSRREAETA